MRLRRGVAAWCLALGCAFAPAPSVTAREGAEPATAGIAWGTDFKAALRQARESGRPVLVDFWAEWCVWCHKLDATTYRDAAVIDLAGAFVPVKVDTEGSLERAEIAARYGAQALPTIAFLSPAGRLFLRRTAYEEPEAFRATLKQARELAGPVAAFEAALARREKDPEALAGLGALLAEQGLFAESLDPLRNARKADQGRPAAERKRTRRALALAEAARGKRGEADKLLAEALALEPADPDADAAARQALAALPGR
jgi:thiol-disulfide isomerase/thioredoxin